MRRAFIIIPVLMLVLCGAFLLVLRYRVVADEGYPTWEAVRNFLIRDGEIVITLPEGIKAVSAKCDDSGSSVSIQNETVTVKIGYTSCTISIDTEIDGMPRTLHFKAQKFISWSKIQFVPDAPTDPHSEFTRIENGMLNPLRFNPVWSST